jgi:uncharacterized protein (DUF1684 family)
VPETRPRINSASLLDWRRRVAVLYAQVREEPDPAAGHRIWVAGRDELLGTHDQSPIPAPARARFSGVAVAPYDPARRFVVEIDTDVNPERLEIPTGTDGTVPFERTGVLHVPTVGDLDVWWMATYGGGVFVPVKDVLAGAGTYGGGRYLIDTVKGADLGGDGGELVVDLNFAYNPSCAYDPAWACPLAPSGNTVPVELPVGEMTTPAQD